MALQKQSVVLTFSGGLDLKSDPNQIPFGKFSSLSNSVFDTLGRLTKRNGFGSMPVTIGSVSYLSTYQKNLVALGQGLQAFSPSLQSWTDKGFYKPMQLSVTPLANSLYGMSQVDSVLAPNGLVCAVYSQGQALSVVAPIYPGQQVYLYQISDAATGQAIVGPSPIVSSGGLEIRAPRVFLHANNFVIVNDVWNQANTSASISFLQATHIPVANPTSVGSITTVSSNCSLVTTNCFNGVVASNTLVLGWRGSGADGLMSAKINPDFIRSPIQNVGSSGLSMINMCADTSGSLTIWYATNVISGGTINFIATDYNLTRYGTPYQIAACCSSFGVVNCAMSAQLGVMTAYMESTNGYSYDSAIRTNIITSSQFDAQGSGSFLVTERTLVRGLGLASNAFLMGSTSCFLGAFQSPYQSTYFLVDRSGSVLAKVAYGNGNGYLTQGLPSVTMSSQSAQIAYLQKNTISPFGTLTNVNSQTGVYSTAGINLANFDFTGDKIQATEIGTNLHMNGGFLWSYDGTRPVEHGTFLFPDSVEATTSSSGGSLSNQTYYYAVVYEWKDNVGNIFRSAPSIPITVTTVGGGNSKNTINVPTLRLSYKGYPYYPSFYGNNANNPVQVSVYRSSTAQPVFYKVSSNPQGPYNGADSLGAIDVFSDGQILGNEILYTNGGVIENICSPAVKAMTLFDSRMWFIDAEDPNLLWFSKQVIEGTPVELSDLLTFFVPPTTGAEGPTGVMECIFPMDDKLLIFKKNAIYYINGAGPDNTGANNQYSQPIFITGGVGCSNQNSLCLIPNGVMFQSSKGIWLLGRDLSIQYIGKDVEAYNQDVVMSVIAAPLTNQIRFHMKSGVTLMYDYFVNQWGTFSVPARSATLYNNLHTYVNASSSMFQETPQVYSDGSTPVQMSWTTGWINMAGLAGYKRIYRGYMLGNYQSGHSFQLGLAYDYNSAVYQTIIVQPTNTTAGSVEEWQLNFQDQQCQSFQMSFNEYVANSTSGAGLTVSGMNIVAGIKSSWAQNIPITNRKT